MTLTPTGSAPPTAGELPPAHPFRDGRTAGSPLLAAYRGA